MILIHSGSSTDLLRMLAYKQMGFPPFALENPGRLLSEFNGATTTSQGNVVLPVWAGPVTLNMQFSVIEDLSSFKAIMRCACLHRMKVIPFTYHKMGSIHLWPLIGSTSYLPCVMSTRREVEHSDWLKNVVIVPKKGDQIVDATVGHGMFFFFIVALSGYHQIPMFQPDEKKTAFMMPHGLYSYKVMSFGLKNADATSKINDKDIQAVDRPNRGSLH
ncbi:hypothetical protein CK203_048021 [Vitis vinifera]|uniref:Uncharacterized protein n=1 Tax=Vitis vinifera TaxID=29760 RepID=A0A438GHA1_VITVI|nr:hypothetical protein CK203_048021 [Vitis vinifera]